MMKDIFIIVCMFTLGWIFCTLKHWLDRTEDLQSKVEEYENNTKK